MTARSYVLELLVLAGLTLLLVIAITNIIHPAAECPTTTRNTTEKAIPGRTPGNATMEAIVKAAIVELPNAKTLNCTGICSRQNRRCPSLRRRCPQTPPCPAPICPPPECPIIPYIRPCPEPDCPPLSKIPPCPQPIVTLSCPHVACPQYSCPACPKCSDVLSCPVCSTTSQSTAAVTTRIMEPAFLERTTSRATPVSRTTKVAEQTNTGTTVSDETITTKMDETIAGTTVALPPGYEWAPGAGAFKFFAVKMDWATANTTCSQNGAYLVIPNSRSQMDRIVHIMRAHSTHIIHVGYYAPRGKFISALGDSMAPEQRALWQSGEPSGVPIYGCAYMSRRGIATERCGDQESFVCEISMN